jgi:crotonobetainyl-CoA:carnitine CoA-transferase CaiB-like acyl-CoA transferase
MGSVVRLGELLECPELAAFSDPKSWFEQRDEIKQVLVDHLLTKSAASWLSILEPADIWCAEVLNMQELIEHDGFKVLDMVQEVSRPGSPGMRTLRCPIRVDGRVLKSNQGAPRLGADTAAIKQEFALAVKENPDYDGA